MSEAGFVSHRARRLFRKAAEALESGHSRHAADCAARCVEIAPNWLDGWMILSEALQRSGADAEGLRRLEQAEEFLPDETNLRVQRCAMLLSLGQRQESRQLALQLIDETLEPWALETLAVTLSKMGEAALSAPIYGQLCEIEPDRPENWLNLGMTDMATGNLDQARAHYDRALSLQPGHPKAMASMANVRTATSEDNQVRKLSHMLQSPDESPIDTIALGYALGKDLEDLGQFEQAFAAFESAARLRRQLEPYDAEAARHRAQQLIEAQNKDFCSSEHPGDDSDSPIFILGMPRSGTTLVERILGNHPAVCAAGELRQFPQAVDYQLHRSGEIPLHPEQVQKTTSLDFLMLGRDYLRNARPLQAQDQVFTDKLPLNFWYTGMICRALPRARIIHVSRNPMDVIWSNFKVLFGDFNKYSYDLEDTLKYYIQYHRLMNHWHEVLGHRIHHLNYEQLVSDSETQVRRVLEFCDLDWSPQCLQTHQSDDTITTASAVQVRQPIHGSAIGFWRHHEDRLGEIASALKKAGIPF